MPAAVSKKLRIREGQLIRTLHEPANYRQSLGELPPGIRFTHSGKEFDQLHWFVMNRAALEKKLPAVIDLVKGDRICWIMYPKGSSKLQTDLNRDTGWDELMKYDLQFISLISFDDTWSAFGIRQKTDADRKNESKAKDRPVFKYVDPVKKTVRLPEDLAEEFKKHIKEAEYFHSLAFTHKKEYIEWIVTAKREETRRNRLKGTVDMLKKGWKNPANRG